MSKRSIHDHGYLCYAMVLVGSVASNPMNNDGDVVCDYGVCFITYGMLGFQLWPGLRECVKGVIN